jgi:hypothetical protein
MFHRWLSTDGEEDVCIGCGTRAPDAEPAESILSDHSPLPLVCPGPLNDHAHHFMRVGRDQLQCVYGDQTITDHTSPADVTWECHRERT